MIAADRTAGEAGDHYRDGDPRPGRFSRNGRRVSLLGRRFGPPTDEGAWARRLAEIRAERTASEQVQRFDAWLEHHAVAWRQATR